MSRTDAERLRALGRGMGIAELCEAEGWERPTFDTWWLRQAEELLPDFDGVIEAAVAAEVSIVRDARGVPHCFAEADADLFVAYGYSMALDRLFQLDMQRRKGHGRLAALIGRDGLEHDRVAHTMGLPGLAAAELDRLDDETRALHDRFAAGIELAVSGMADRLPIEYALLGAAWEPWTALDSVACGMAWRWQFTGRPHAIAGPELLRRVLDDDRLVEAILAAEREADTPTLPPDAPYPASPPAELGIAHESGPRAGSELPAMAGDVPGSNNWVMSGSWSRSGSPLMASDPHMPYESFSAFYEVGLHSATFDAVGAGMVGVPGMVMGRNRRTAWGFTNNAVSLRDLYQERASESVGAYEYDGLPVQARRERIDIEVRDEPSVAIEVERTERGPVIDAILPEAARETGPVSMRWLGADDCKLPAALLRLTRADSVRDALAAVRGWLVPSFGLVLADVDGDIGFVATGRVPLRSRATRTYRSGWDPADHWVGLIPDEAMPQAVNPSRGWLTSANNRLAPDDYPYPQSGTWTEGYRVRRVGSLIEALEAHGADRSTLTAMHQDVLVSRAEDVLDSTLDLLAPGRDGREQHALELLRTWDQRAAADSAGAAIFEVFFHRWAQAVMAERVADAQLADYLANWALGVAARLLGADDLGWFATGRHGPLARATFAAALDEIEDVLGPDIEHWRWGALRPLRLRHPLGFIGGLSELLDVPVGEVGGDMTSLSNSGFDGSRPSGPGINGSYGWRPQNGAGYRLEVDLGEQPPAAWAITLESQSAMIGSRHNDDQVADFLSGRTQRLALDRAEVERGARHHQRLAPDGSRETAA